MLALWAYLAVVVASILLWTVYRAVRKVNHAEKEEGELELTRSVSDLATRINSRGRRANDKTVVDAFEVEVKLAAAGDAAAKAGVDPLVKCKTYRNSAMGTFAFTLVPGTAFLAIAIYFVIVVDYYWGCQLKGIDALCFYGSYPLSGGYAGNSMFFFVFWWVALVFFSSLLIMKVKVRNFFREPCSARLAQYVWVWVPLEEEVLMKASTPLVRWLRTLKKRLPGGAQHGFELTVPVRQTSAGTRYYELQATRYVLDSKLGAFLPAQHTAVRTYEDAHRLSRGLGAKEAAAIKDRVGPNLIPFEPDTVMEAVRSEFFTGFYLYQLMVYMVWIWFSYLFVGAILALVVLVSGAAKIYIKRLNQITISRLTKHVTDVEVLRDGQWEAVSSEELVPGDAVRVQADWLLPCDMVILEGSCVCNESALTGESMPVQKVQVPSEASARAEAYDPAGKGKRHSLFSGTTVLQASEPGNVDKSGNPVPTVAIVTSTGIGTSKGDILSAILYPTQQTFRYDEELPAVVIFLAAYAAFAFALSVYLISNNGGTNPLVSTWAYAIFTVSQIMSPLLPVALIAGQVQATVRLADKGVFCINPARIAIAGKIRVYCFDKTGTLTTDTLDFLGAREVTRSAQDDGSLSIGEIALPAAAAGASAAAEPAKEKARRATLSPTMERVLASCHAVAKFGETFVGNQVEVQMFRSTGWEINAAADSNTVQLVAPGGSDRLEVLRRFEFDHARQMMSVVVRDAKGAAYVFSKGSFEKVAEATRSETVPSDYQNTARGMALDGCYVLGISMKSLDPTLSPEAIGHLTRDDVEKDLDLLGLIAFRNELKHDTAEAIGYLKGGDVRPVMITGDNAQCGHYIAAKCGMTAPGSRMLLAELDGGDEKTVTWNGMTLEDQQTHAPIGTNDLYAAENMELLESGALELAITGKAYDALVEQGHLDRLMMFVRVYARVTPANKIACVKGFVDKGLVVGMCGDGGNDCGALREAHAGVALSDAEASIVSPFTSKQKTCMSVVDLLKEGKAALHTNISSYKFLIIYGLLFSVWKLTGFYYGVLPAMLCYLMVDVIAVVGLTYALTCAKPKDVLHPERPTSSLFSPTTLGSALGNFLINFVVYVAINLMVPGMAGYLKWPSEFSNGSYWWVNGDNWESTGIFWPVYFQVRSARELLLCLLLAPSFPSTLGPPKSTPNVLMQ